MLASFNTQGTEHTEGSASLTVLVFRQCTECVYNSAGSRYTPTMAILNHQQNMSHIGGFVNLCSKQLVSSD